MMKLNLRKKLLVISVSETKNPKFANYTLVSKEDKNPDVATFFGVKLPVEPMTEYTFDINLTIDKKSITENGQRVMYDVCRVFVNGIIE